VFEIGYSLRSARERQGIGLPEAELATKIRAKYIRALEEEDFDALPADTYARGFLRTYADYLGLDGEIYVDEYASRFHNAKWEDEPRLARSRPRRPRRERTIERRAVLLALAGDAVVTALVIVAWKFGGAENRGVVDVGTDQPTTKPKPHRTTQHRQTRSTATKVRLVVSATKGSSWVEVHKGGSAAGEPVFQGTIERGDRQVFTQRRLWIRIDYPRNVVVKLNGLRTPLSGSAPVDLALTNRGLKPVE
jgi:cytoskeletal protein RodZ